MRSRTRKKKRKVLEPAVELLDIHFFLYTFYQEVSLLVQQPKTFHNILFFLSALVHELTEEEKLQILHSEEFANFFDHSTRIIERALSEHIDLFFDYSGRDLEEKEG